MNISTIRTPTVLISYSKLWVRKLKTQTAQNENLTKTDFMFLPQKPSRELLIAILALFHTKFVHFRGFPSEYLNYWDTHSGGTHTPNPK